MKKDKSLSQLKRKEIMKQNYIWIFKVTLIAFVISFMFSFLAEISLPNINFILGILIVLAFIAIGVVFDMVGVAVTTADASPFHSMNSRKIPGASVAIKLIKNASVVSSFCCASVGTEELGLYREITFSN